MTACFGPQNGNVAKVLPPGTNVQRYGTAQTWVQDASAPGRNDGTVLDAAFFNRIVGNLEYMLSQSGVTAVPGDMTALYRATIGSVATGAPELLSTLKELADSIADDPHFSVTMTTALNYRLRYDALQILSGPQRAQALANMGVSIGTGPGQVFTLDGTTGKIPTLDGSLLTNVTVTWGNVTGTPFTQTIASGTDFNSITTPGTYYCNNVNVNANEPTGAGQWYLEVLIYSTPGSGYVLQRATSLLTDRSIYVRVLVGGVWQAWTKVLTMLDVGTAANNIVQLNGAGKLPAVDGSLLTGVVSTGLDTVGLIEYWPTNTLKTGRLRADGSSFSRATYPALAAYLVNSGTVTFTNGSANVGWTGHNRQVGDPIKLFTTGALPTNFAAGTHGLPTVGTNYFVASVVDANTITLSATVGGAAITAGSAGSGTQTAVSAPHGDGDGSTTATLPDHRGEFVRGLDLGRGVDTNRSIGTKQLDQMQGHVHTVFEGGGTASYGPTGTAPTVFDGGAGPTTGPVADGTNGAPRTGLETRPRNVAVLVTIRYQ